DRASRLRGRRAAGDGSRSPAPALAAVICFARRLPPPSILSQGHAVESIPKSAAWSGAATQREVADQGVGLVMVPDGMDRDAACRLAIQFLEH
ncbi:unnamed protein product, partial [Urochloa humidicola]